MSDTTSLLLGSSVSILIAVAIGYFGKKTLIADVLLMLLAGLAIAFGYLLIFGSWSDPVAIEKLLAFLLLSAPGFIIYFFLPLIPGYMLGIFIKEKIDRDPDIADSLIR